MKCLSILLGSLISFGFCSLADNGDVLAEIMAGDIEVANQLELQAELPQGDVPEEGTKGCQPPVAECRPPVIKPRCKPSSDDGQCECPLDPTTSLYIDCCCEYIFINEYDFYYRVPKFEGAEKDWSYYTNGDFVADGGLLVFTKRGGLLNTSRYTTTVAKSSVPYLDNYKYLAFADEPLVLPEDNEMVIEYWLTARTFNTGASPYPQVLVKCPGDDVRLAAASVNVYDPATELFFNYLVTNDMVYAVYGRNPDKQTEDYNYAAFTFLIPLLWRKPSDTHKLKIILNKRSRIVRWKVDNKELFRVDSVGARLDRKYMTVDFGGADDLVFPVSVKYGFGSMTLLNDYPACWRACENSPCSYPAGPAQALYKTGDADAPEQFDPLKAKPYPAVFWNSFNLDPKFRVWGQGSATFFKRISVYEQACQQQNVNRFKTVTVTSTITGIIPPPPFTTPSPVPTAN